MSNICFTGSALCLVYYVIIILFAGITADFAWIWPMAAVGLGLMGMFIRINRQQPQLLPSWLKWGAGAVLLLGIVVFACLCLCVLRGMVSTASSGLDYVVVLGAQVKGEVPSRALRLRLQAALEYAEKNPDTMLVLSGGQGSGEEITEAECMRRWLTERGISPERLILEERSASTRENLEFSHVLTGCAKKRTGILSNNFHVYRALRLARRQGYTHAEGIAAASDPLMQVHYVVREVFALVKEKLRGNI